MSGPSRRAAGDRVGPSAADESEVVMSVLDRIKAAERGSCECGQIEARCECPTEETALLDGEAQP